MKTKILLSAIIAFVYVKSASAQFQYVPFTALQYGSTTNTISGVGIGLWPIGTATAAALHVNTNLTVPTGAFAAGEVFLTESPYLAEYWRMWHLDAVGTPTEYGTIFQDPTLTVTATNLYTVNDFTIQASAVYTGTGTSTNPTFSSGNLSFNTGIGTAPRGIRRLFITNGAVIPNTATAGTGTITNDADILTDNFHRMVLTKIPSTSAQYPNGFGGTTPADPFSVNGVGADPTLLVVGGNFTNPVNMYTNPSHHTAEFRSAYQNGSQVGINLRGSAAYSTGLGITPPITYLDFSDYDDNAASLGNNFLDEYGTARIGSGIAGYQYHNGWLAFYTNSGNINNLNQPTWPSIKVYIHSGGNTGIGNTIFDAANIPQARLEVAEPYDNQTSILPQFRLTNIYNNTNVGYFQHQSVIYTDFIVNAVGNLRISPHYLDHPNPLNLIDLDFQKNVGITNSNPVARLDVKNSHFDNLLNPAGNQINLTTVAGNFLTTNISIATGQDFYGLTAKSDVVLTTVPAAGTYQSNTAGYFTALNGHRNYGVISYLNTISFGTGSVITVPIDDKGITSKVNSKANSNFAGYFQNIPEVISGTGAGANKFGIYTESIHSALNATSNPKNYALYAKAPEVFLSPPGMIRSWAGYFNGALGYTGSFVHISDSALKTNINPLINGLTMINALRPKSFDFDTLEYTNINLPTGLHYGFIAQEVKLLDSNLVSGMPIPDNVDSIGGIIDTARTFLGIESDEILPYTVRAIQELDSLTKLSQNGMTTNTADHVSEWGTNPLLHNTDVPMIDGSANEWTLYFTGQSQMVNSNPADVGIGYSSDWGLGAKLDVKDSTFTGGSFNYINQQAARFYHTGDYNVSTGTDDQIGVIASCDVTHSAADTSSNIGGDFYATNSGYQNIGTRGIAYGDGINTIGVLGMASTSHDNPTNDFGGLFIAGPAPRVLPSQTSPSTYGDEFGVYGSAQNNTGYSGTLYGVYGDAIGSVCTSPPCAVKYAGYFNGNVIIMGNLGTPSDQKLKHNIQDANPKSVSGLLSQLHTKTYEYETEKYKSMSLPSGSQYGLLAQDVEKLFPQFVIQAHQPAYKDESGNIISETLDYKAIDYQKFIPLLIAANQEKDSMLASMQQQLNSLQNCCSGAPLAAENVMELDLSDADRISLGDAFPDPFSETTTINYHVAATVKGKVQIIFADNTGREIKTIGIIPQGDGSIVLHTSTLSAGTYHYSLMVDGKVIESKQMVKGQ